MVSRLSMTAFTFSHEAVKASECISCPVHPLSIHPGKLTCWSQKWRFNSDNFPFQLDDCLVPALNFPWSRVYWMDLVGLSFVTEAAGHVRRMSSVNHTEIHNYTEINQLLGGEIPWNFLETLLFSSIFPYFSLFLIDIEKFLDVFWLLSFRGSWLLYVIVSLLCFTGCCTDIWSLQSWNSPSFNELYWLNEGFFPAKPHHCRQQKEAQKPSFVSGVFVPLLLEPRISCPLRTVEQHNDNSMNFSDLCLGG